MDAHGFVAALTPAVTDANAHVTAAVMYLQRYAPSTRT